MTNKYTKPCWKGLRELGESKVLKLTILTPFLGYLIVFSQQFQSLMSETLTVAGITPEPAVVSFNLYAMYIGLLGLGLASVLYTIFAPSLVKEYLSNRQYVDQNIDQITISKLVGLASHVRSEYVKGDEPDVLKGISSFEATYPGDSSLDDSGRKELRNHGINLFNHFWNETVHRQPELRKSIKWIYITSFSLLSLPSLLLLSKVLGLYYLFT
ncbi:hypothetical protein [Vibrio cyclitrophicus]|uniref:Uncharacterized protein n=1 Tax=Vibrio cyclitrophicus ZF270 TaxID=1136176 RepID=A0AAN0LMY4_9VIBR|nr:hypothetical protein [Vibrio cyclitrophicus]OEE04133.1 hypothetical protein OC7_09785 [Vibrio cyclitrophicus ZF270]